MLFENLYIILKIKAALLGGGGRLCEGSVYNIFALKCGVCSIVAFTVNRLNTGVAFIYFIEILVHLLQCIRGVALYMWRFLVGSSAVRNHERADKNFKSVPRVLLKTKQNFMTVPKCIIDVIETRTI